ncbi:TetR/AcrR family transcriptional regulator [Gammaproteobacteria bacterium]|nr:TetR/AcrR family transcriptional regulator [Gammaproteobacteria bacterium]
MKTALLRKKPKQTRSKLMVNNILEASIRVLKQYPYHQFTTNRVAEAAGISIGSLYQYFPNKQSILLELEIKAVDAMIENVEKFLFEDKFKPEQRLYHAIEYFFVTESSFYEIPFSSNFEYPTQLNRIKNTIDSYLRSNGYIDEKADTFLSEYLVVLVSGIAEQLGRRSDIGNIKPWTEMTFDLVMHSIRSHQ